MGRHTRLAAVLHQSIIGMRRGQSKLVGVRKIKIVNADHQRRQPLALLQGLGEGAHEGGLADALHTVEADDEWPRVGLAGVLLPVGVDAREDEGDADGGLVVDDARLQGDVDGRGRGRGLLPGWGGHCGGFSGD